MNVSGHRISTIEVECALVDHQDVAEAAVAARNDATTGQAIVAFVTLKSGVEASVEKLEELRNHVAKKIGPIAKPANIVFTPELPKTRSGKIMRRLLRDVAENRPLGDTTTLADPAVVDELQRAAPTSRRKRTDARRVRRGRWCSPSSPGQTATVRVPVANVWEAPNAGHLPNDPHVWPTPAVTSAERRALVGHMPTQVLYGERVLVLARRGGWTKIAVPDQPSPLDPRGYPGWVRAGSSGRRAAALVVTARRAKLSTGAEVGFGTDVPRGAVPAAATRPLPHTRADLVRTAKQFLGLQYLWGGLSAWGYDCSGLTWAVYRAHGITIPRDADAQFAAGRPISLEERSRAT